MQTFAALKSAIADFLNRDDLTAVIPTFVALAEADMNRKVRAIAMETRSTATLDAQFSGLPSDWLETISIRISGADNRLVLASAAEIADLRAWNDDQAGEPTHYAHVAGGLELYPTPEDSYTAELVYYAKPTALSTDGSTNWLLTNHPDAYLYGSLVHSAPYLKDDPRVEVWAALYANAIQSINQASQDAKFSGTGLRLRFT